MNEILLAQNSPFNEFGVSGVGDVSMGKVSAFGVFLNVLKLALIPITGIAIFVFWLIALIGAINRKDLRNSRVLWILLIIFVGPIGMIVYFFMENRKKLGVASIVVLLVAILYPVLMMFVG
jgi:hypothetical protein